MASRTIALTFCGLVLFMFSSAAADETAPAILANACAGCHGPAGMAVGQIPQIYGLPASEIAVLLRAFKNDRIVATMMNRIAKGYSDAEIDAIASYLEGML